MDWTLKASYLSHAHKMSHFPQPGIRTVWRLTSASLPVWFSILLAPVLLLDAAPVAERVQQPAAAAAEAGEAKPEAPTWLGVQLESGGILELDDDEKPPPGVGILGVVNGGPAEKAGLKQHDRVLKIGDKVLKEMEELRTAIRASPAGKKITFRILRDGEERDIPVVLEKMPAQAIPGFPFGAGNRAIKPDKVFLSNMPLRVQDPNGPDIVSLRDGNRLEGKVQSMNDTDLAFKLAGGPEVQLILSEVVSIRFAGESSGKGLPADVLLRGGGRLAGSQLNFAGGKFSLTLERGSRVELDRGQVAEVALSADGQSAYYSDPALLDGWKAMPGNAWTNKDGTWQAVAPQGGALARKFANLPASMECEFDVSGTGQANLQVALFTFRSTVPGGSASAGMVQIQWSTAGARVMHFDGQRYYNVEPLKPVPAGREQAEDGKVVRHSIFCDRVKGLLVLMRDGVEVGRYEIGRVSVADLPRAGRVIQFFGTNNLSVSGVTVRPWFGFLPKTAGDEPKQDAVVVGAEDLVPGEITGITDSQILMAGRAPVPRTKPLILKFSAPAAPRKQPVGGVWIETRSGSGFVAESASIIGGTVKVKTGFAGELSFPLDDLLQLRSLRPDDPAPAGARPDNLDVLTFSNGRQISGTFAPAPEDGKIAWKISAARTPLDFPIASVAALLLAPMQESAPAAPHVVRLRNGDWLTGEIKAMDAKSITLKTPFHDSLKTELAAVRTIYASPTASTIADGGSGRERWKKPVGGNSFQPANLEDDDVASPSFAYSDGAYSYRRNGSESGNASIALPVAAVGGSVSIEFTVSGPANALVLQLLDPRKQYAYYLSYSGSMVQLTRMIPAAVGARQRPEQFSFKLPEAVAVRNSKIRVQMIFDPGAHAIHLVVDGRKAGTCKLKKDTPWTDIGNVVFSSAYSGNNPFSISDVWVAPWDGRLPEDGASKAGEAFITLSNGDESIGRLVGMNGDEVELESDAIGSLPLPLSRIRTMQIHPAIMPRKAAFHVRLDDRGLISADELKISGGKLAMKTHLGELSVPLGMVKEITFKKTGAAGEEVAP